MPCAGQTLFDEEGGQGQQGDDLDGRHGPALDGAAGQGGEDEKGGEQGEGQCCAQMRAGSFVQLAAGS